MALTNHSLRSVYQRKESLAEMAYLGHECTVDGAKRNHRGGDIGVFIIPEG